MKVEFDLLPTNNMTSCLNYLVIPYVESGNKNASAIHMKKSRISTMTFQLLS